MSSVCLSPVTQTTTIVVFNYFLRVTGIKIANVVRKVYGSTFPITTDGLRIKRVYTSVTLLLNL